MKTILPLLFFFYFFINIYSIYCRPNVPPPMGFINDCIPTQKGWIDDYIKTDLFKDINILFLIIVGLN